MSMIHTMSKNASDKLNKLINAYANKP